MRRTAAMAPLAVAGALALGGCGSSSADYKNDPRPPGLIVTNQTGTAQRLTLESADATGAGPGLKQVTAPISPQDTATLKVDVKPGSYSVHVAGGAIRAAGLQVGPERASAQNDLLQP